MAKEDVEKDHVRISVIPPPSSTIKQVDEVFIVITQAFCPNGHSLIADDNETFDGYPGVKLHLECGGQSGDVTLSPFHGDYSKKGKTDWTDGSKLTLSCPTCEEPLPRIASCRCPGRGDLVSVFLTPNLSESNMFAICNIWGCRRSRSIDNWQIISEYFEGEIVD